MAGGTNHEPHGTHQTRRATPSIGTTITALLPALFASVSSPGSTGMPMIVGTLAFAITVISAIAASSARDTYRVHLNGLAIAMSGKTTGCGPRQYTPVPVFGHPHKSGVS